MLHSEFPELLYDSKKGLMTRAHGNRIAICTSLRLKPTDLSRNELEIDQSLLVSFSHFLNSRQSQLKCYSDTCSKTVDEFLNGRNCTLFVYGQTGSGKTHTLFGPPNAFHGGSLAPENVDEVFKNVSIPKSWGAFPRIVLHLLHASRAAASGVTATAVEIYMDNCYDLMRDKQKIAVAGFGRSSKTSGRGAFLETCEVKRDSSGKWIRPRMEGDKTTNEGYAMRGAKSTSLSNVRSLLDFMCVVEATRTSKSHKLNERSSRSHCVITLSIPSISSAKYMLVDLAGSERIMKSGSIQNNLKSAEARNINTSLTSLGRCISALASGNTFVPYRDSVLTMLLKQSLGGRCFTSVVITGTGDEEMHFETKASIQFGKRCSKVANRKQAQHKMNNSEMKSDLFVELQMINNEIKMMVDSGSAGGLNKDFPKTLQQSFTSNMKKYQTHKLALQTCKQQIKSGKTEMEKAKKYEESQVRNLQGILLRSMTTGVWTDPCARYIKNVQRRIDIISTLRGMHEHVDSIPNIEIPLTFDHLLLGYEG